MMALIKMCALLVGAHALKAGGLDTFDNEPITIDDPVKKDAMAESFLALKNLRAEYFEFPFTG